MDIDSFFNITFYHFQTVVSRLGGRRPSLHGNDDLSQSGSGGNMTQRSTGSEEAHHILTWKKGNILGKGAYGTVGLMCHMVNSRAHRLCFKLHSHMPHNGLKVG